MDEDLLLNRLDFITLCYLSGASQETTNAALLKAGLEPISKEDFVKLKERWG